MVMVPIALQRPTLWSYSPVFIYLYEERNANVCLNRNEVEMKSKILIERGTLFYYSKWAKYFRIVRVLFSFILFSFSFFVV